MSIRGHEGIKSLPDELLYRVLTSGHQDSLDLDMQHLNTLPLVCKKFQEVLFLQGRCVCVCVCVWCVCVCVCVCVWHCVALCAPPPTHSQAIAGRRLENIVVDYNRGHPSLPRVRQWMLLQQVLHVVVLLSGWTWQRQVSQVCLHGQGRGLLQYPVTLLIRGDREFESTEAPRCDAML